MFEETEYECCFCSKIYGQYTVKICTTYKNNGGEKIDIYQVCDDCYGKLEEGGITKTTCCGEYLTKWDNMCPCTFKMITGSLSNQLEKKVGTFDHRRIVEKFPIWESPSSKLAKSNYRLEQQDSFSSKTCKSSSRVTTSDTSDYSSISNKEKRLKEALRPTSNNPTFTKSAFSYDSYDRVRNIERERERERERETSRRTLSNLEWENYQFQRERINNLEREVFAQNNELNRLREESRSLRERETQSRNQAIQTQILTTNKRTQTEITTVEKSTQTEQIEPTEEEFEAKIEAIPGAWKKGWN